MIAALPDDRVVAVEALRGVIEQLRIQQTAEGRRALARGLEALADRSADVPIAPAFGSRPHAPIPPRETGTPRGACSAGLAEDR